MENKNNIWKRMRERNKINQTPALATNDEQNMFEDFEGFLLNSLVNQQMQQRKLTREKRIAVITKSIFSIFELKEQGVLSEKEVELLLAFITSKFVEQQVADSFERVFEFSHRKHPINPWKG